MKKIFLISLLVVIFPVLSFSATTNVPNTINVKFDTEKITMTDKEDIATINLKTRDVVLNNKFIIKGYKYDISDSFIRETLKNKDGKIVFNMNSIVSFIGVDTKETFDVKNTITEVVTFESCVNKVYDIYNYILSDKYTNTVRQQEEVIARILEIEDILNYKEITGYGDDDKGKAFNMMINKLRYMASDKGTKIYNFHIKEFEEYNGKFKELYNK